MSVLRPALVLSALWAYSLPVHAIPLAPQIAGTFVDGDGANSLWMQVTDDWRGTLQGDQSWGTGIWGLADQALVMDLPADDPAVLHTLSTRVAEINFGDQRFIDNWGATWGSPSLAPIFDNHAGEPQDNWASRFWGYVAVTMPGYYNFSVLYDDGFRFSLLGADSASLSIAADGLNARDRMGFAEDLFLGTGLYGFQLDAYERLEAGVVQLAWQTPGSSDWRVVPQTHLFTSAVPEPATSTLLLTGLGLTSLMYRARRRS